MSQNNDPYINSINDGILENLPIELKDLNSIKINIEVSNENNKENGFKNNIINDNIKNNEVIKVNNKALEDIEFKSSDRKSKIINYKQQDNIIYLKKNDQNKFQSIGIYYIENSWGNKIYYNILHRKIFFQEENIIDNFFFQDVSDLIDYQINEIEHNLILEKLFGKISHEFKTPLNTIMAIIDLIKNTEKNITEGISKNLEMIFSLSNHIVYLVSDIIQYVNLKGIKDINVISSELNLKKII